MQRGILMKNFLLMHHSQEGCESDTQVVSQAPLPGNIIATRPRHTPIGLHNSQFGEVWGC